jgi:DNA-directed RNA polymerase subunit RPC12/RpoP
MWSYVAKADGVLTFYTTGIDSGSEDTYGSVYDADDYTYSTNVYTTMSASAIASNDDQGSNVNFKITCSVEKGKRYYLSSIMRNPKRVGSFMTYVSFACTTHEYTENIITKPNCAQTGEAEYVCSVCGDSYKQVLDKTSEHDYALVDFNDALAGIECSRCNERYTISFMDYLDKQNDFLDVNGDSIVNAKDYALLKQMNK